MLALFHYHSVASLTMADHTVLLSRATGDFASLPLEARAQAAATTSALLSLRDALASSGEAPPGAAHTTASKPKELTGYELSTRGLLRAASHAGAADGGGYAAAVAAREIGGQRGALPAEVASALSVLCRQVGLPPPAAEPTSLPPPTRVADGDTGLEAVLIGDTRLGGIAPPARPELVPQLTYFDSYRHTVVLQQLLKDWAAGHHLLMIGGQGVGKNKLADRLLQLLRREREYMQLHRDVTVASLTQTPSLLNGRLVWEDSPLVRAISEGRVLVLDEADKAPLEVTCVLRSLLADGQMLLADGRRVAPVGTPPAPDVLPIAEGFRAVVLANKPGYPFLGNDFFREVGDVLATHVVENPDLPSEVQLLAQYGPDVPHSILTRVASVFAELRALSAVGELAYPFSTREAVSLVRHMQAFPEDGLLGAADNVFSYDSHQPQLASQLAGVLRRHGVPAASGPGGFSVELAPTSPLPPSDPVEAWAPLAPAQAAAPAAPLKTDASWLVEREPSEYTEALHLGRMRVFTEEVRRWRLPTALRPEAVVGSAVAADGSSHLLASSYAGLHLFSFSPSAHTVTHTSLGRSWATKASTAHASLHAMPAAAGGGLLLHLPAKAELLHLTPPTIELPAVEAKPDEAKAAEAKAAEGAAAAPAAPPAPKLGPGGTFASTSMRLTSVLLPEWLKDSAASASADAAASRSAGASSFLSSFGLGAAHQSAEAEAGGGAAVAPSVAASCVPGHADVMQLASVEGGRLRLAKLGYVPPASPTVETTGAASLGEFGLSVAELDLPPEMDLGGGIALQALCADSSLVLSGGGRAAILRWGAGGGISLLPVERKPMEADAAGGEGEGGEGAALMPGPRLALLGDGATHGAWVELSPLLRGEAAFALSHRRLADAASATAPIAAGFSLPPDTTPPEVEAAGAEEAGAEEAAGKGAAAEPPRPPELAPTLVYSVPASVGQDGRPATLELVDLHEGSCRSLPLLPSDLDGAPDERRSGGAAPDPRAMEALRVTPVPSEAGGGSLTLHRNGELVLWQTHQQALAFGVDEWKRITGYSTRGGGKGKGKGEGLSVVKDFPSPKAATMPKHGKVDPTGAPHVGGNTWAGGTGGRDTAGLGGKGGPYRLSDGNPIHQISDEEKANVSPEALKAARELAADAWKKRLEEIDMSEGEANMYESLLGASLIIITELLIIIRYESLLGAVSKEVRQTRVVLQSREARKSERVWLARQSHGELDESRLVDGITGERAIYRRRAEQPPLPGAPQLKPKLLRFVIDCSGSMYYFNGHDRRLERTLQTAVMIFEAFAGFEDK